MATRDLVGIALRSVERLEVSLAQFRLLLVLHEDGRLTSSDCARRLGVAASTITRSADRLHGSGHLIRGADPANRSIVTLELTPAGRKLVQQVLARRRRELSRVLDRLDPAERSVCATTLRRLHDNLVETRPEQTHPLLGF